MTTSYEMQEVGEQPQFESEKEDVAGASEEEGMEEKEEEMGNTAWADCMTKILNVSKPASQKFTPLSRAKKFDAKKVKEEDKCGFEVTAGPEDSTKDATKDTQTGSSAAAAKSLKDIKPKKKNLKLELRVKTSWKDLERERTLRKVATRGVVQLFNAVRAQQRDLDQKLEEAGPLDSRRAAVLNNVDKKKFLDYLMSGKRSRSEYIDNPVKLEQTKIEKQESDESSDENNEPDGRKRVKSTWSVFDDNFLTAKKKKSWDLEEDEDENGNDAEGGEKFSSSSENESDSD